MMVELVVMLLGVAMRSMAQDWKCKVLGPVIWSGLTTRVCPEWTSSPCSSQNQPIPSLLLLTIGCGNFVNKMPMMIDGVSVVCAVAAEYICHNVQKNCITKLSWCWPCPDVPNTIAESQKQ